VDWLDLQRIVTALIMPLPLGVGLSLAGLVAIAMGGARRLGLLLAGGGLATLTFASLPWVAQGLMASLEGPYPPYPAAACSRADAILVLGGAMRPLVVGDVQPRLHPGSDRVWQAARLWHAGCAPQVVVSAGGLVEPPVAQPESQAIAALLTDLGVAPTALVLESESRNTQGNAASSQAVLAPLGVERVLLVTSAWHLRRAVALFERAGFEVIPAGADYRAIDACRGLDCWVPNAGALETSGLALKEYLGYWVQVMLGR